MKKLLTAKDDFRGPQAVVNFLDSEVLSEGFEDQMKRVSKEAHKSYDE